jgi:hypothetical protein
MFERYRNFLRGVSSNWLGKLGVILVTSSFVTLVVFELARLVGMIDNAYVGLVTYMVFPALFILGLILIPFGWRKLKRESGKSTRALLRERFAPPETEPDVHGSRVVRTVAWLTVVNVVFLVVIGSQLLHFMDQPHFCGTACHSVMHPEWETYQLSPHARVKCVECHVGEGVDALVDAKLNGLWQIISVTFDLLERPIPTPVHQLRPARETCEQCHWPDKFYGNRIKTVTGYAADSQSTKHFTTLNLKIDASRGPTQAGIHWHIADANEVRYTSVNDEREKMIWVEVLQPDSSYRRYVNRDLEARGSYDQSIRVLDCVDCHNRATHIYHQPEDAVDRKLEAELLPRELPFIKREALAVITNRYPGTVAANEGIANQLHGFYRRELPQVSASRGRLIDSAVTVLQRIHHENVFPRMNITWGAYPSHIGHEGESGCFRCHNDKLVAADGGTISYDCTLCHSILADNHRDAFHYLSPPDTADPSYPMHRYLRQEFLRTVDE